VMVLDLRGRAMVASWSVCLNSRVGCQDDGA
jgi:hypothetical protein